VGSTEVELLSDSERCSGTALSKFSFEYSAIEREGRLFPLAIPVDRQRERGAFYTPRALAELVAERCLGEILSVKAPRDPGEIRVLDPACGSGAFLLASYRILLRYFSDLVGEPASEELRLQILTESLFGGDNDHTAVALSRIQLIEEARVDKSRLPTLGGNIGWADLLDISSERPDGWEAVAQSGGFDVILSNPPFHSPRAARQFGIDTQAISNRFQSAHGTGWNIAAVFVEAGISLLGSEGRLMMLLPQSLLDGPAGWPFESSLGVID